MKKTPSRAVSYLIITLVYLAAAAVGILTFRALPFGLALSLLLADVVATVFVFLFSLLFGNASVYDPYWSVQPPVILAAVAAGKPLTLFSWLLLAVVLLWGIRLTANWAYTFPDLSHEDWRYRMLRQKTGRLYPIVNFVGIHLVPTLVVYLCTLPAATAIQRGLAAHPLSYLGLALSVCAVLLQTTADCQMHAYRKNRTAPFIRVGVWRHSRHPNYLAEILFWWGIGLAVLAAAPSAYYLLAGALANTLLFLFVSIPLAEGRQGRKEGYAAYRAETRALLPIPKHR